MKQNDDLKGLAGAIRAAGPYVNASYTLIAAIAMFGLAGWWLDSRYNTEPLFLIIGLFFGLGIGFYSFIKVMINTEKSEKKEK